MKNKKKAIFLLPYFGKLPNYFQLYLQSCKYNKDFDWLIITDDLTRYEYPLNVKVVIRTFEEIRELIQSKFDFVISLDRPYKLCDFRPAYGYIFQDYIIGYGFWGSVDPDCIWGDLNKYITWDILDRFDKLFLLGHLTLYRNTMENNRIFMYPLNGLERFKEVFMSPKAQQFDEAEGNNSINDIYSYYHIPVYEDKNRADVSPKFHCMRLSDYKGPNDVEHIEHCKYQFFEWTYGQLNGISYTCSGMKKQRKEYSYLHLHGERKMIYEGNKSWGQFYISWNRFQEVENHKKMLFHLNNYIGYIMALFRDKCRIFKNKMRVF